MLDMESTGLRRSARLANKPPPKVLSDKLSLALVVSCDVTNNPHIFITRENQQTQEINRHFDRILNNFDPMAFAANQEKNYSYTFKEMFLQP